MDLDCDTIKDMVRYDWSNRECIYSVQVGKLHILFGEEDGWCPLSYRDNLLANVPDCPASKAITDTRAIPHAFVEEHSEICAEIVADWILRNKSK